MSPVFSHGQLRLYLLNLLQDGPRHGYDLIKGLSDQFAGTYTPSPGTIYPRLAKLVDEGLVSKRADGRRTLYELTDAGRAELQGRAIELTEVETDIAGAVEERASALRDDIGATMDALREDLGAQAAAASGAATPTPIAKEYVPPIPPLPGVPIDPRTARHLLKQAEMQLDMFRAATRAELRVAVAQGKLTMEAINHLRESLEEVGRQLHEQLPR